MTQKGSPPGPLGLVEFQVEVHYLDLREPAVCVKFNGAVYISDVL